MNASDAEIYQKAEVLLLNGDVKAAVKHLTSHKKNKLALMIAQSINSKRHLNSPFLLMNRE